MCIPSQIGELIRVAIRAANARTSATRTLSVGWFVVLCVSSACAAAPPAPFKITVVDEDSGRGVPLVELRTVHDVRFITDSAGVVAFDEPGLLGEAVFFHVSSHGYEFPKDGFGFRGVRLETRSGGDATLKIKRLNIAERLYRVTGAGCYRDSLLTGGRSPIAESQFNAQVLGSDSVVSAVYRSQIFWFWGDTNRASYPLGNFHVPGAISKLPSNSGLSPDVGIDLSYFTDEQGFAKATCRMPGEGPTWINGLSVVPDETGRERLFAAYAKVKPPLTIYRRGLGEFNVDRAEFQHVADIPTATELYPFGHSFRHRDASGDFLYFGDPYPTVRVSANAASLLDLSNYEGFSCLRAKSQLGSLDVERNAQGQVQFSWKKNTTPISHELQDRLVRAGKLKRDECPLRPIDVATNRPVTLHRGSTAWNDFRRRWVTIATQSGGSSSLLGEVFYLESEQLTGPWTQARKIVTHDRYSFYNPKHHAFLDEQGGRIIYFEGTYTHTFSGNPLRTPRYDYNQIMYKLDLANQRLALP